MVYTRETEGKKCKVRNGAYTPGDEVGKKGCVYNEGIYAGHGKEKMCQSRRYKNGDI